ncbi:hypothetical protein V492_07867 [Pseudogymnoascus sp. VKM F-4246]|nr:hypothetical protein V492_07867 [Pseudogymnoascus sp. VKM F-4246]
MLLLRLLVVPALFQLSAARIPGFDKVIEVLSRGNGVENRIRGVAAFQCPINDVMLTQCRGEKDCLYPNPGSCNSYIQCTTGKGSNFLSATPEIMKCAPDHEWNDKEKKCDTPGKSTCPVLANVKDSRDVEPVEDQWLDNES